MCTMLCSGARTCACACVSVYDSPCSSTSPPSRRTASTLMTGVVVGMQITALHPCAPPFSHWTSPRHRYAQRLPALP